MRGVHDRVEVGVAAAVAVEFGLEVGRERDLDGPLGRGRRRFDVGIHAALAVAGGLATLDAGFAAEFLELFVGLVVRAPGGLGVAAEPVEGVKVAVGRFEEFRFDRVSAVDSPLGVGEFGDEEVLGRGAGVVLGDVGVEEVVVGLAILGGEDVEMGRCRHGREDIP